MWGYQYQVRGETDIHMHRTCTRDGRGEERGIQRPSAEKCMWKSFTVEITRQSFSWLVGR